MVIFPNAKINLGLHILRRRTDGFHDIETVFYPVPLVDILEYTYHKNADFQDAQLLPKGALTQSGYTASGKKVVFQMSGLAIAGDLQQNLIFKALQLFDTQFGLNAHVHLHLHKKIPMGAGLGGGSADAAFLLKQLWHDHNKPCTIEELQQLAAQIGSDCAFFITNQPAIATGRGEVLSPIAVSLKDYSIVIVKPAVHISTAEAYAGVTPFERSGNLAAVVTNSINEWNKTLANDFEESVFRKFSEIGEMKTKLLKAGAVYSAMSGSGSAVFGIFEREIPSPDVFPNCYYYCGKLI